MVPDDTIVTRATLAAGMLAFLLAWWLTGRLRSHASRLLPLDEPKERSLHASPTPRTGGLAILAGLVTGLLVGLCSEWLRADFGARIPVTHGTWWILITAMALGAVSFWDDLASLPPGLRFGVHGVLTAALVALTGLTLGTINLPLVGTFSLRWIAFPVTVLFIMWMTNLYNFMDGMDGLAGGMTVVGCGVLGYLAWIGGHRPLAFFSLVITAATGGFLVYNMPPARIFMGDVGSVPLGFLTGTLAVKGVHDGLFDLWVPVLIFSPFILDASLTLLRRLMRGERVWQAHREHYYQRLVLAGWGHRRTLVAEYVLMVACGVSGVIFLQAGEVWRVAILLAWGVVYWSLASGVHGLEERFARQQRGAIRKLS